MELGKISSDEADALQEFLASDQYKLALKYMKKMGNSVAKELVNASIREDNLTYLKGKADGAKQMVRMMEDFKPYLRHIIKEQRNGES